MFTGILYAVGAMLSWGFGDFTIERSTLKIGGISSLFYITLAASVILFPFALPHIGTVFSNPGHLTLLTIAGVATFGAASLQFIAFEKGKLSVVEPILGLELPLTIGLAIALGNERLTWLQAILTIVFFIGLILAITRHRLQLHYHKRMFEHGVILSLCAAVLCALQNFTYANGSQQISPIVTLWFASVITNILCLVYLSLFPRPRMISALKRHWKLVLIMIIIDNLAWVFYNFAVERIPISLAITIGEGYVVLATLLGLIVNRDKVKPHQIAGMALACSTVIILAYLHPG